ncbi:hypothetical protein [Actinomadura formosensis]|uniref:hypothetical protein n=1 Tax=Actinomadura formosensis TaxID=60706 RepID=UPI003D913DF2
MTIETLRAALIGGLRRRGRVAHPPAPPMRAEPLFEPVNAVPAAVPADRWLPHWAGKPVRWLTAGELAEALEYLERHRPDDDVLGYALAAEFARRTAEDLRVTGRWQLPSSGHPAE